MADQTYVLISADVKSNNVSAVKPDGLKKAALAAMTAAVNAKSSLTTKTKSPKSYTFVVSINLKGDNGTAPTSLEVNISAIASGSGGVKHLVLKPTGKATVTDLNQKDLQGDAEFGVTRAATDMMVKAAIPAML